MTTNRIRTSTKAASGADSRREQAARHFRLDDAPGYLFRRVDTFAAMLYEAGTGQAELTPRQFGILIRLFQEGPMKQSQLGLRLNIDRSTMGEMIARMADRGLVHREAAESRRSAELSITPVGRKMLLQLIEPVIETQNRLLALLPAEYRGIFLKSLKILSDSAPVTMKPDGGRR